MTVTAELSAFSAGIKLDALPPDVVERVRVDLRMRRRRVGVQLRRLSAAGRLG